MDGVWGEGICVAEKEEGGGTWDSMKINKFLNKKENTVQKNLSLREICLVSYSPLLCNCMTSTSNFTFGTLNCYD